MTDQETLAHVGRTISLLQVQAKVDPPARNEQAIEALRNVRDTALRELRWLHRLGRAPMALDAQPPLYLYRALLADVVYQVGRVEEELPVEQFAAEHAQTAGTVVKALEACRLLFTNVTPPSEMPWAPGGPGSRAN